MIIPRLSGDIPEPFRMREQSRWVTPGTIFSRASPATGVDRHEDRGCAILRRAMSRDGGGET